jgi:hypothetical protein
MYVCYLDESGNDIPGSGTSHFVYLGLAIPAESWKAKDKKVSEILQRYSLQGEEVHTGWIARRYLEQERIPNFANLDHAVRRAAVQVEREKWLIKTAALGTREKLDNVKTNLRKTAPYVHLTQDERTQLLRDLADLVGDWHDTRLFAEAQDKTCYSKTAPPASPLYELAFTQIVSRFQMFLTYKGQRDGKTLFGMMVHDNNQTISRRLTDLMRHFHKDGTKWRDIPQIIETPMFVDSSLTAMVQLADLCAYATRRFFENRETDLFDRIYPRFDRTNARVVGIRHYRHRATCACRVCVDHR